MNVTVVLLSLALLAVACAVNAAPSDTALHSALHPLAAPEESVQHDSQNPNFLPTSLVWQEGRRAFYSRDVNAITASSRAGKREWLATALGVKYIDHTSGEVRHFTRLDGLPGERVVAVAAGDAEGVYCVCQTTQATRSWAICRFDAVTERWATEREVTQPNDTAYQHAFPASPVQRRGGFGRTPLSGNACPHLAVSAGSVFFAPDVSLEDADPLLLFRRPGSGTWREAKPGADLRSGVGPLHITSLQASEDGVVWLGTNHGLWRYNAGQDQWTQFLPHEDILLAAAQKNDVWTIVPSQKTLNAANAPTLPRLIRLVAATGGTEVWPLPSLTSQMDTWTTRPSALSVAADGRLWVCEGSPMLGHGTRFCAFDPASRQWQTVSADGSASLAAVPDGAFPLPLSPSSTPAPEYRRRFSEWFCPDEFAPVIPMHFGAGPTFWIGTERGQQSDLGRYQPIVTETGSHYPAQTSDPDGVAWALGQNAGADYAIIRVAPGSGVRDVYPWLGATIRTNPTINTLGYIGDRLLVTTEQGDWAVDPKHETWNTVDLWQMSVGGAPRRVIVQGGYAWIGDGNFVARYDPKARQAKPWFQPGGPAPKGGRSLLAVTGAGRLWMVAEDHDTLPWQTLSFIEPGSTKLTPVPLTLPEALRPPPRDSGVYVNGVLKKTPLPTTPDPVAVSETPEGDMVWCIGWMTIEGKQVVCLIGLNPKTHEWTKPQPADWPSPQPDLHPITVGHKVYLAVPGKTAGVWVYDISVGAWDAAAPPVPDTPLFGFASSLTLISVSPDAIWGLDTESLRVCRFDRQAKTWSSFNCPVKYGGDAHTDKVAQAGNALFVASREGLWRFDLGTQTWRRLPVPGHDGEIQVSVATASSIWGKTIQGVARFDKATRHWTTFNRPDDAPQRYVSNDLAADEKGAWLYGNSPAYRLDAATGQWADMTHGALADPHLTLLVQDIVPDGRWVWLLPGEVRIEMNGGSEADAPLLGRYDAMTGQMDWLGLPQPPAAPGTAPPQRPTMLLVEKDVVWVGAQNGVYCYDKKAQRLNRFQVPAQYPVPEDFVPTAVFRTGRGLWLSGNTGYLLWNPQN